MLEELQTGGYIVVYVCMLVCRFCMCMSVCMSCLMHARSPVHARTCQLVCVCVNVVCVYASACMWQIYAN